MIDFNTLDEEVFPEDGFSLKMGLVLRAITDMYYFGAGADEWEETMQYADLQVAEFNMRYEEEINAFAPMEEDDV